MMGKVLMVEPNLIRANQYVEWLEAAGWYVEQVENLEKILSQLEIPEVNSEIGAVLVPLFHAVGEYKESSDVWQKLIAKLLQKSIQMNLFYPGQSKSQYQSLIALFQPEKFCLN